MLKNYFLILFSISFILTSCKEKEEPKISVAEWSLHRTLRSGHLTNLEFPGYVKKQFNVDAVEFVNQFFFDRAEDTLYLQKLKDNCDSAGVQPLLIMIDGEGKLAELNDSTRTVSVNNHKKWIRAAHFLGCHSIRVNTSGDGNEEDCKKAATKSLKALSEYAQSYNINIIVENHGGYSSNGKWLSSVIKTVNMPNCGTLPDFGNFYDYDRYIGVDEMMPFAKGVSAKTNGFKANGEDVIVDFKKMLNILKKHNYKGYIGIEYEGPNNDEIGGIKRSIELLKKHY